MLFLFVFVNFNIIIIIGVNWHNPIAVLRAFQVSWIECILLILRLIIAEYLMKMNFLRNSRKYVIS